MGLPLENIRVVDMTRWAFGPFVGACLADMGAEVIKVEDPVTGDGSRYVHKSRDIPLEDLNNPTFELLNRGKKSITIDMMQEQGREVLYSLVKTADVFITAQLPKSTVKLGIDYETLSGINSRLVYVHCGSWGSKGPLRDAPAFDGSAYARSGLMYITGEKDSPPPNCPMGMGDLVGSVTTAYGIMTALFHRERTGKGQKLEVSLFGTMITVMETLCLQVSLQARQDYPQQSRSSGGTALNNTYKTRDGRWLLLNIHQTDPYWHEFCERVGLTSIENDPRFYNHLARDDHADELRTILDDQFATKDLSDWTALMEGASFPWSPVRTLMELWDDPQALENDYIVSYTHPTRGPQKTVGLPVKLSDVSPDINYQAPELGQNTEEILLELGYNWDDIQKFKEQKIIR